MINIENVVKECKSRSGMVCGKCPEYDACDLIDASKISMDLDLSSLPEEWTEKQVEQLKEFVVKTPITLASELRYWKYVSLRSDCSKKRYLAGVCICSLETMLKKKAQK